LSGHLDLSRITGKISNSVPQYNKYVAEIFTMPHEEFARKKAEASAKEQVA
jgi:hypothetical protein